MLIAERLKTRKWKWVVALGSQRETAAVVASVLWLLREEENILQHNRSLDWNRISIEIVLQLYFLFSNHCSTRALRHEYSVCAVLTHHQDNAMCHITIIVFSSLPSLLPRRTYSQQSRAINGEPCVGWKQKHNFLPWVLGWTTLKAPPTIRPLLFRPRGQGITWHVLFYKQHCVGGWV